MDIPATASSPFAASQVQAAEAARSAHAAIERSGFVQARVGGTPLEMGLQHGEILRQHIRDLLDAMYHHVLFGTPGAMGWGIRQAVRTVSRVMAPQIPLRYRQEMAGIAHAANVPYGDILLVNCFDDVLANLRLLGALFGRLGCSTFALLPDRTEDEELICGRNLDYFVESAAGDDPWAATRFLRDNVAVVEFAPVDRASFVGVGWPGFVGTVTGMSARQMVVGSMVVATPRTWPLATPAPFLYRRIMEETGTLDGAIDLLRRAKRSQGNNVLVGSGREGTAAIVEFTPSRVAVRGPNDGWIFSTNHFNHPSMRHFHGRFAHHNSLERYDRLDAMCGATADAPATVESASRFLADLERAKPEDDAYCSVWNPCTLYSTMFAPARGKLWVRAADRPDRPFEEVTLG
jgi:hypothetical protein